MLQGDALTLVFFGEGGGKCYPRFQDRETQCRMFPRILLLGKHADTRWDIFQEMGGVPFCGESLSTPTQKKGDTKIHPQNCFPTALEKVIKENFENTNKIKTIKQL
jgi:hypothetical protein